MNRVTRRWLIIILVLVVANILVFFLGRNTYSLSYDQDLFVIEDTSAVQEVVITDVNDTIRLSKHNGRWEINNEFPVDPGLRHLFFSIMQRVQVKKPAQVDLSNPLTVELRGEDLRVFQVFGNPTKTTTYFSNPGTGKTYEVEIPGYNEYLGAVFELKENQWRDRLIINETWRTIQQLHLDYTDVDQTDLQIKFENVVHQVSGIGQMDTLAVEEYLNQFEYFAANEMINRGQYPRYDSLSNSTPIATLGIESINRENWIYFRIFPRIGYEAYHLVSGSEDMMLVDRKRIAQILREPAYFGFEGNP